MHEKREYYDNLIKKIGTDSRAMWSVMNSLIGKTKNKLEIPFLLKNNHVIHNKDEISNTLNEHFSNAGMRVQSQIKKTNTDVTNYLDNPTSYLNSIRTTEDEITKIVNDMKAKL